MTDSPEIKRLREQASSDGIYPTRWVTLAHAEQAVRDAEARVRAEKIAALGPSGGRVCPECGLTRWEAKQADGWVAEASAAARREAFREAVEALRERTDRHDEAGVYAVARALREAADFFESRFLSHPDNPEGNV